MDNPYGDSADVVPNTIDDDEAQEISQQEEEEYVPPGMGGLFQMGNGLFVSLLTLRAKISFMPT